MKVFNNFTKLVIFPAYYLIHKNFIFGFIQKYIIKVFNYKNFKFYLKVENIPISFYSSFLFKTYEYNDRKLVEKSGAKVDVNDEGVVTVAAPDEESRNIAMQIIKDITAKAELNKIYSGKVMKIMEFGAFVNFLGKQDGLVHISELAPKRVEKVTDVVKEGDEVKVKVIGFDRGKVKLSMKQAAE